MSNSPTQPLNGSSRSAIRHACPAGAVVLGTLAVIGVLWFLPELVRYIKAEMM